MAGKRKVKIGMGTFDLMTGLAVILVVVGHMRDRFAPEQIPLLTPLFVLLWAFGAGLMPMFFIVSGLTFKEKSCGKILQKSFSEMVVPYLWSIPLVIVLLPLLHYPAIYPRVDILKRLAQRLGGLLLGLPASKTILGYELLPNGVLWFFLTLFISQNLLNLIVKIKKPAVQILAALVCAISGYVLRELGFIYFCIPHGMMAAGFCYAGYAIKKRKLLERWMHSPWAYIVLIPLYCVQYFFGGFNMASGEYALVSYFSAGCGGILLLLLALWCSRLEWSGLDGIRKLGMQSFWLIYTHGIEHMVIPWYELAVENSSLTLAFLVEVGLKVMIFMTGCMIFKKISQIKYHKRLASNMKAR